MSNGNFPPSDNDETFVQFLREEIPSFIKDELSMAWDGICRVLHLPNNNWHMGEIQEHQADNTLND